MLHLLILQTIQRVFLRIMMLILFIIIIQLSYLKKKQEYVSPGTEFEPSKLRVCHHKIDIMDLL